MSTRSSSTSSAPRAGFILRGCVLLAALIPVSLLVACGGTGGPLPGYSSAPAPSAPSAPSAPITASATPSASTDGAAALKLTTADSPLGSILVDGKGMTLYLFTKDGPDRSVCEGQCLVNWPPLLGTPTAGEGADDSKLGSFMRADGTTQATYNGWPMYYWKGDAAPGDVTGQNVQGVWFVLDRDGEAVKG